MKKQAIVLILIALIALPLYAASTKISGMTDGSSSITSITEVPVVRGGANEKVTVQSLHNAAVLTADVTTTGIDSSMIPLTTGTTPKKWTLTYVWTWITTKLSTAAITIATISAGAGGFAVDADGDVTGKSFTTPQSAVNPDSQLLRGPGTNGRGVVIYGPATEPSASYGLQYTTTGPAVNDLMYLKDSTGTKFTVAYTSSPTMTAPNIGAATGTSLTLGTTAAGGTMTTVATEGAELAPALAGASGVNWTFSSGFDEYINPITGGIIDKKSDGTHTITPTAASAVEVGAVYRVVLTTVNSPTTSSVAGYFTITVGGQYGTTITPANATTYTQYFIASTTGNLIITPTNTSRFGISSISMTKLSSGSATVGNGMNITAGQLNLPAGSIGKPSINFGGDYGIYRGTTSLYITDAGTQRIIFGSDNINIYNAAGCLNLGTSDSTNVKLYREASNTAAFRNGTGQQKVEIYNTADSGVTTTNYERTTLTGVAGYSINRKAETAGTGADNLDILDTPAGTGGVGIQVETANVGGGLVTKVVTATTGALSGASGTITLGIPAGCRIKAVQLRVDTAITFADAGDNTWTAAYTNTPTTAICSGKAKAKDTVYNALHAAYEITTGTVAISITPSTSTFTAGVIRAVVYYETLNALSAAP